MVKWQDMVILGRVRHLLGAFLQVKCELLLRPRAGCEILQWVCLSVCLLTYLQNHTVELYHFLHVARGRGSVLL